jgi:hypothetical protein
MLRSSLFMGICVSYALAFGINSLPSAQFKPQLLKPSFCHPHSSRASSINHVSMVDSPKSKRSTITKVALMTGIATAVALSVPFPVKAEEIAQVGHLSVHPLSNSVSSAFDRPMHFYLMRYTD